MKEDMALSPTPTPFWKKKLTWKQSLTIILVMVCLSLLGEMVRGTKLTFDRIWKEEGHAYDVETEYFIALFAGGGRSILIEKDWDQSGILPSLLQYIHGKAYKSAMEKIPETDGERDIWFFEYKISPFINKRNLDKAIIPFPDILKNLHAIVHKPIKSRWFREIRRYNVLYNTLFYFSKQKGNLGLSLKEQKSIEEELLKESFTLIKTIKTNNFIKTRNFRMTPLRTGIVLMDAVFRRIQGQNFSCDRENINYYLDSKTLLTEIAKEYKGFEQNLTAPQQQEMLKIAYKARDMNITLRQKLLENCQVDIQQLERQ